MFRPCITAASSNNVFFVDELTGKIFLRHPLDFETVSNHYLQLKITDIGQSPKRSTTAPLNITVHNVNEHPPVLYLFLLFIFFKMTLHCLVYHRNTLGEHQIKIKDIQNSKKKHTN